MDPAQRQEFEAHLASCPECQEQVAAMLAARLPHASPPAPAPAPTQAEPEHKRAAVRLPSWKVLLAGLVTLSVGFAIGWSLWQMAHR